MNKNIYKDSIKDCNVLVITGGSIYNNSRLEREIDILVNSGYRILVLWWNFEGNKYGNQDDRIKHKSLNLKTKRGCLKIPYLIFWWFFIFYNMIFEDNDIIHVINFDSVFIPLLVSKISRKYLIYEMYDTIEDMYDINKIIKKILFKIDTYLMKYVDAIVLVDECRIKEFNSIPNDNIHIVYNSPTDIYPNKIKKTKVKKPFTLFYAGELIKSRESNLINVCEAVSALEDVKLIIAGRGDEEETIIKYCEKYHNNIEFLGLISYSEVLKITLNSDLLFCLYNPKIRLNKYGSPNKFFESTMAGKPILISKNTEMAKKVEENACGLCIDPDNIQEI
jgi:glycosyltransferase involved in cell wall biosynthesis